MISREQFDNAYETARMMINCLPNRTRELQEYCLSLFARLNEKLLDPD